MSIAKKTSGLALATAAAALLSIAPMTGMADGAKVKCVGGNACKGQSACATATTGCNGQNSCKGHGWTKVSAEECKAAGGTTEG